MDAHLWKLLVDKAILRTKSRDLLWSETNEGPDKALSFGASIDDSTTLNIWGYETNYSYELRLTKKTAGEPFEERKRVTTKKNAEGVNFKGLFEAAKMEIKAIIRDRAFAAVMEYMADPTVEDSEKQEQLRDSWEVMGENGYFLYTQDEKILTVVRDLTAANAITWCAEQYSSGEQYFTAEIGDLLYLRLQPIPAQGRVSRANSYTFSVEGSDDSPFSLDVELSPHGHQQQRPTWLIADEIHTSILESIHQDEFKFNRIVRDNMIHDILASLDAPRMEPSPLEGT